MTNRLKGLDFAGRVPEELWTDVHSIVQDVMAKIIPKKKKCKKAKWLSEELRKEDKRKAREKGKDTPN